MIFGSKKVINPSLMIPRHFIDDDKVEALCSIQGLPLPVVADYGDFIIPIDGHHRISASDRPMFAWVFDGQEVDDIDWRESEMMCGNVLAMNIAGNNL